MSNFKLMVKINCRAKLHKLEQEGIVIYHQLLRGNLVPEDGVFIHTHTMCKDFKSEKQLLLLYV